MSKFVALTIVAVLAVCLQRCEGSICQECDVSNCIDPDCYEGAETITDMCGCCQVCTKGLDELCEGSSMYGKCSEALSLQCQKPVCKKGKNCASLPGICKPE